MGTRHQVPGVVSLESLVLLFHGTPPLRVGKRITDNCGHRRKGRRRGRGENQVIRGPEDTRRAPGDHHVDVSRIPVDDDGVIGRGLGARANRCTATTATLVRLDGVGVARRRGRTCRCGRRQSRTGLLGRHRGHTWRRRGRRGRTWLCEGGRCRRTARGDTWDAEAARGCEGEGVTVGGARGGAVDGPAGKGARQ
jgi:hypothetical protein